MDDKNIFHNFNWKIFTSLNKSCQKGTQVKYCFCGIHIGTILNEFVLNGETMPIFSTC